MYGGLTVRICYNLAFRPQEKRKKKKKKTIPRHSMIPLLKTSDKRKNLKRGQRNKIYHVERNKDKKVQTIYQKLCKVENIGMESLKSKNK